MSAAETLAQHQWNPVHPHLCRCGTEHPGGGLDYVPDEWMATHQLDALKAAGHAVFELAPLADILETRASRAEDTHDRLVMAGMRTTSQFHSGYASAMLEARTEILSAADAAEDYYPSEARS